MFVCHRCDNPPCCNPSHLFLGSPKDNLDDMYRKGRQRNLVGEQRAFAKLTQTQVLEIRARYASGEKQRDLASEFNVRQPRISKIVTRKAWRWL
jgi:HNH endonuclease